MLKKLFTNNINNLGRWSRPKTKVAEDIKILLAIYDSCGDHLWGTPSSLKKDIDNLLKEHNTKKK